MFLHDDFGGKKLGIAFVILQFVTARDSRGIKQKYMEYQKSGKHKSYMPMYEIKKLFFLVTFISLASANDMCKIHRQETFGLYLKYSLNELYYEHWLFYHPSYSLKYDSVLDLISHVTVVWR